MKMSSFFLETSMPTKGWKEGSCCMVASLPCGCELGRQFVGPFNRLFGLARHGERRSSSVTASTRASRHDRSAVRRRDAGFSLRFEARVAACDIKHCFDMVGNIQATEVTEP